MYADFNRPNYQKFLMSLLVKRQGPVFVSKHSTYAIKHSNELFKQSAKLLKLLEKIETSCRR